jgi:hypothetical protein
MPSAGANVTLRLSGVTHDQFLAHQAEYNHLIAQARPSAALLTPVRAQGTSFHLVVLRPAAGSRARAPPVMHPS